MVSSLKKRVIPENSLFPAFWQGNANLSGIRFYWFFFLKKKPNRIPDQLSFAALKLAKRKFSGMTPFFNFEDW